MTWNWGKEESTEQEGYAEVSNFSCSFVSCVTVSMFACLCARLLQSCLTPWDPMDRSPPSSSVHGILQVRILEWAAMPSSGGWS